MTDSNDDLQLNCQIVCTAGNIDRTRYQRLVDFGWRTRFVTNASGVEYVATDQGQAAAKSEGARGS